MEYQKGSYSIHSLQYHIVFCTKYRYRVLTGQIAIRVRELVREICAANYIGIISGSMNPDHVHLLLSIPPYLSLLKVVQSIKGKTSRKLQQEFAELRKKYWGQYFWARGYFVVTVGNVNEEEVQRYIEEQELHHKAENFKISNF
jgi:putative transposase